VFQHDFVADRLPALAGDEPFGTTIGTTAAGWWRARSRRCGAATGAWTLLSRHITDWGDLDTEDLAENELSLVEGCRLLSGYTPPDGPRLWIITEADRSATTMLLPEEA